MVRTSGASGGQLVEISDVTEAEQLIDYALHAQVELIKEKAHINQATLGEAAGLRPDQMSKLLHRDQGDHLPYQSLRALDKACVAIAPTHVAHVGGLSHLALRLRGLPELTKDQIGMFAELPPSWTPDLLRTSPRGDFDVLTHAAALLSTYQAVQHHEVTLLRVQERYRKKLLSTVHGVFLLGVAPPTARNVEALVMLGRFGTCDLEPVWERLEDLLRTHPLGFRLWRAITKLVLLVEHPGTSTREQQLELAVKNHVRELFERAGELHDSSIYPARSLDLELAIAVPPTWSPTNDDWVREYLLRRARDAKASVRERGTAAFGLLERLRSSDAYLNQGYESDLVGLIAEFREPMPEREEVHEGLAWVAHTLEESLEAAHRPAVWNGCSHGGSDSQQDGDDPPYAWLQVVDEACAQLRRKQLPEPIREATITLFRHTLLQNAGVHRRQAMDTLVAGGWTREVSEALIHVLTGESKLWLRIRALFALGFLQQRDTNVISALVKACTDSCRALVRQKPSFAAHRVAEAHAALFAVGDCFGAFGAEQQARIIYDRLSPVLVELVDVLVPLGDRDAAVGSPQSDRAYPVARALAYLLAVTGQRAAGGRPSKDPGGPASERITGPVDAERPDSLLHRLTRYEDPLTRKLAHWGLGVATQLPSAQPVEGDETTI